MMRHSITMLAALAALGIWALEVPEFEGAREEFLKLSPAERRAKFTDAEWRKALASGYGRVKWHEAKTGETSRWRKMSTVANVRDLGGLTGLNGVQLKTGKVYRSAQLNRTAPFRPVTNEAGKVSREYYGSAESTLTPEAVAQIGRDYGIKTDLDLRGVGQCRGMKGSPLGNEVKFVNVALEPYEKIYRGNGAQLMAEALRVFAHDKNYPIIFHCVKGADRTGSLAFILEALLGVSAEDRLLDWEFTAFTNPNVSFAHAERYDRLVDGLAKFPGANDAEKALSYVKSIGLSDAEIAAIRRNLLGEEVAPAKASELAIENAHSQGRTLLEGRGRAKIALDRQDATYRCEEKASFTITVNETNGVKTTSGKVKWTLDNYGAEVIAEGEADLASENPFVVRGTLAYPGFLRVTVRNERGKILGVYSAAYEPEKIRTAVPKPDDFDEFWDAAVARLNKEVPLDVQIEPLPKYEKRGIVLSRISFATLNGKRVYGALGMPKDRSKGPFPVDVHCPGAGPGFCLKACFNECAPDRISLFMSIHTYPIQEKYEDNDPLYDAQEKAWREIHGKSRARAYPVGGLTVSREAGHYFDKILGINRAIDWVAHLPEANSQHVSYSGASQGGGLGLILAGLNKSLTHGYMGVPALCDLLSCKFKGRQSGWPRITEYEVQQDEARLATIQRNARYFDAAYFAERIKIPVLLSVGYIDESCAPHSVLAAYNAIPVKEKKLYHGIGGNHGSRNAPREEVQAWLKADHAKSDKWFVINEDNDHFFKCDSSLMTVEGLENYLDYICRGKVTHLFFCVSGQRTSYDSSSWEPIWEGINEPAREDTATATDGTHDRWAVNAKKLHDAGIDPYSLWISRCREKGVSPWVSMRMNDVHGCDVTNYFRNTSFYKAHPEYRLDPKAVTNEWCLHQLNYAIPAVREYSMAQVKEIAARWPSDGVELDWMRFGNVFKLGEERENAPLLDEFMREAATFIHAQGRQVAVRVAYDHEVAENHGFNVVNWAKMGWVDVVIPAPFIMAASELPIEKWREALAGTKVKIVPDLGCEVGCSDRTYIPTIYRGEAAIFFNRGADGVYFYNLPYKSNKTYSTDSRGKAYCKELDVAADIYTKGILPEDLRNLPIDCPAMYRDWPWAAMRNDAANDALYASRREDQRKLQNEIDTKSKAGGGIVVVNGDVYCDGPIRLRSNIELHFADGARLLFNDRAVGYLPVVRTSWEGVECLNYSPLVYAYAVTNVAITGKGVIEPRIDRWIEWCKRTPEHQAATRQLYDWCSFGEPVANRDLTKLKVANVRPQLVQFNRCANVRLDGFKVRKSPFWVLHFLLCDGVEVRNVDVVGMGRNNDGLDLEMTRNVLVDGCSFMEGDDAIVIKAGRNHDGWRLNTPSENIEIRNCRITRGNAILGIGSEMSGGVRNVWMHDCLFDGFGGSFLEIKTNERRGGFVENICVENCEATGVLLGSVLQIATDCFYQWKSFPTHEVRVPAIRNVTMRNVHAFRANRKINVCGDARNPVEGLKIVNVTLDRADDVDVIENIKE